MKKGCSTSKSKNWLIAIIILTFLIVVNFAWLLSDLAKTIKYTEKSNSGWLSFFYGSGEVNPEIGKFNEDRWK